MEFELIKPWNGVNGSGKDARLAINRNFELLSEFLSNLVFGVLSDGSVERIVAIEEVDFLPLLQSGQLDEKTFYIVLNPSQQSNIEQLLADLASDLDSKADAQAVAQSISQILTSIGTKANQQDLYSLASLLQTSVVQQDPDWHDVFLRNGSFVFVDDEHGMNRPIGFIEPPVGTQRKYNVNTWAISQYSKPNAQVRDMASGNLYVITLEDDGSISAQGLATSQEIGDIGAALESIQSLVTSIIG